MRKCKFLGYIEELYSFFKSIEANSARSLTYSNLIKSYLQFMKVTYGYSDEYFHDGYSPENQKFKDYEDYIYQYHMGLCNDLRREYKRLQFDAKSRVKQYNDRINNLKTMMETETDKYIKEKFKFFLDVNLELYEKAKGAKEKTNIFYAALNRCTRSNQWMKFLWGYSNEFGDIQQYIDIDWKSKINFIEASVMESRKLTAMKQSDHTQYMKEFKIYIEDHKILKRLLDITQENYYLCNRFEIFSEAIRIFQNNKFTTFVYLLVPQIEGLWDVYKTLFDIKDEKSYTGLSEKLGAIQENKKLWGYVYYAFDFPKLRNNIAHGTIIDVDQEMANDVLMDIFYLILEIDSNEQHYKEVINFFQRFCEIQPDRSVSFVMEYFSGYNYEQFLQWLQKCINSDYDDMISWYGYQESKIKLFDLFRSDSFRTAIFNNDPMLSMKDDQFNVDHIHIKTLNKDILKYLPLLEVLKPYEQFPQAWLSAVEQRAKDIAKEERSFKLIC